MSGVIFLVKDNNELVELHEEPYEIEDHLQGLIAQYPEEVAAEGKGIDIICKSLHLFG